MKTRFGKAVWFAALIGMIAATQAGAENYPDIVSGQRRTPQARSRQPASTGASATASDKASSTGTPAVKVSGPAATAKVSDTYATDEHIIDQGIGDENLDGQTHASDGWVAPPPRKLRNDGSYYARTKLGIKEPEVLSESVNKEELPNKLETVEPHQTNKPEIVNGEPSETSEGTASAEDCDCERGAFNSCCWCELECPECEAWKLCDWCFLKERGLDMGGWMQFGYTANADSPSDRWSGPVGFNDRDEFQMNQLSVYLEKATESAGCCWDFGGRIELLYGTDGRWIGSLGLETNQDGTSHWNGQRFYHLAMPQAYVEAAYADWKIKLGKFVTPLEYEVINPTGNFFYSHSYGFLYAGPFTHTGIYATYAPNEQWTYGVGINRGWDRWEDDNDKASFLGHVSWTSCNKNTSVTFALSSGDEIGLTGIDANRTSYSLALTQKINPRLTYVFVHDYGVQEDGAGNVNTGFEDADWYGICQYLIYQIDCQWSVGGRFEWFRDNHGTRVFPIGDGLTESTNSNPASQGGFEGNFFETSIGVNYKPNANVLIRPEVRWDHFDRDEPGNPFDEGTKDDQFLGAIDVIVKF